MEDVVTAPDASEAQQPSAAPAQARVLVTGIDGYIGSVLAARLADAGYEVSGLDTGFYLSGLLYHDGHDRPRTLCRDVRRVSIDDLRGYDAVVHLAELSNDPLCEFDEGSTYDVNHRGSVHLAETAKAAGVARFVYASSCSVYGAAGDEVKTEESDVNPQTVYAKCKVLVEEALARLRDDSFAPVALRNATAFGASPRMRFDIVLNNLAGLAWTTKCIRMTSDGMPWRPLVHVQDISDAIITVLQAPRDAVAGEIFNVGDSDHNYRVRDIVETVGAAFPGCSVAVGNNSGDNRSYRVSFDKLRARFPAFRCKWDARRGAEELRRVFEDIAMTAETFHAPAFTRLQQLKHLRTTNQIDADLYWRAHAFS